MAKVSIDSRVHLSPTAERGYGLSVNAMRGNLAVTLTANGVLIG
jgi:hypothetical protein